MLKRLSLTILFAATLACRLAVPETALCADTTAVVPPSQSDGPHIVWQTDQDAVVFYLHDDSLVSQEFVVTDTLRFRGLTDDSLTQYRIPRQAPNPALAEFSDASRIFVVSDIHGEYELLIDLLQRAGIVTDDLHWNWGDGHFVIVGDIFDRGDMVTECLWLVYRLEQEAAAQGGRVHMMIGNHEKMVMRGDLRYVNEKYIEGIARKSRIPYDDLYGPDTEIGRWLRTKPTALTVNGILFTHAGVPPRILEDKVSLTKLNHDVQTYMDLSSAKTTFSDWPKYLFSGAGPLWYRGYFEDDSRGRYTRATELYIDSTLAFFNVGTVVVGHSNVEHIKSLYSGKVIAVDVEVDDLGTLEGLLWEDGEFHRVKGDGEAVGLE